MWIVGCPSSPNGQPVQQDGLPALISSLEEGIYKGDIECDFQGESTSFGPMQVTDDQTQYSLHIGENGLPELNGIEVEEGYVHTESSITKRIDRVDIYTDRVVTAYRYFGADAEAEFTLVVLLTVRDHGERTVEVEIEEELSQRVNSEHFDAEQECTGVLSR
jgi:hypothetical protein